MDREIESLRPDAYHRRFGRRKVLREELLPLSRLALRLKQPGLNVEVECFEDHGQVDGHITVSGFYDADFDVELTFAGYDYDQALRSEHLVKHGYVPGAGTIVRNKCSGDISAEMTAVDHDEHFARIANAVINRFRAKSRKAYGAEVVLIIAFDEIKLRGCQS